MQNERRVVVRFPERASPDVLVCPWPARGWAVLRVGSVRPGRTRPTEAEAIRLGAEMARAGRARLYVSKEHVPCKRLAELAAAGFRDGEELAFGPPVIDARAIPSRSEARRAGLAEAILDPTPPVVDWLAARKTTAVAPLRHGQRDATPMRRGGS